MNVEELTKRLKAERDGCENCAWFAVASDAPIGECHRYPPARAALPGQAGFFPEVHRENICGEYANRRTGKTFQADPWRQMASRLACLEDECERLRKESQNGN